MRDLVAGSNCVLIFCCCTGSSHYEGKVCWRGKGGQQRMREGERGEISNWV